MDGPLLISKNTYLFLLIKPHVLKVGSGLKRGVNNTCFYKFSKCSVLPTNQQNKTFSRGEVGEFHFSRRFPHKLRISPNFFFPKTYSEREVLTRGVLFSKKSYV
eukprot:UN23266